MRDESLEAKSVVIRDKMKSALIKMLLAAKARRAAKTKADTDFGMFAQIGVIDGLERYLDLHLEDDPNSARNARQREIDLVTMALQRLSPACVRVAVSGVPVTVTVPDDHSAEVFRAALAASARERASDKLVRIAVAPRKDRLGATH